MIHSYAEWPNLIELRSWISVIFALLLGYHLAAPSKIMTWPPTIRPGGNILKNLSRIFRIARYSFLCISATTAVVGVADRVTDPILLLFYVGAQSKWRWSSNFQNRDESEEYKMCPSLYRVGFFFNDLQSFFLEKIYIRMWRIVVKCPETIWIWSISILFLT